jgi:hypothetical protein
MPTKSKVSHVVRERSKASPKLKPTRAQIQQRAYFIYLNRGATDGWDVEDWLQAEYELDKEYDLTKKEERIKPREKPAAKSPAKTPRNRKKKQD